MTGAANPALVTTRAAASEIRGKLDTIEKQLAPGDGKLDLGAYVRGTRDAGSAGGVLDYEHRINPSTALFGDGAIGYGWGATSGLGYEATAGLRMRF